MRALILTCNTGEGHNSVAAAVQEAFEAHGTECQTMDALSFLSEKASELICRWHARIYRHMPGAWKVSYKLLDQHPSNRKDYNLLARFLALGTEKLRETVAANGYDCLICPHVFSALMVTRLRRLYPDQAPMGVFIATDYTCSPFTENCKMDRYFVPTAQVADEFAAVGIPAERVTVIGGVPVRRAFFDRTERSEARRRLGLPAEGRFVLATCGSMGCGHLDALTELAAERLRPGESLGVVCGTNTHIQKRLEREFSGRDDVYIWGYRDDMSLLMDSADLYLTKSGGVSTSEAAVKGLPMVLVDAVSACEEPNLRHFCATGGAVTAEKPEELAALCMQLLGDGAKLRQMGESILQRENAAEQIWHHLMEGGAARP